MKDSSVLVIVLTEHSDDVAFVNKTLRDAGNRVHCRGLSRLEDLQETLASEHPHLIVFFADDHPASVEDVAAVRRSATQQSPLIVIQSAANETDIAACMEAGAQDLVSRNHVSRVCSVCERELKTFRLERALSETQDTATQYKQQLHSMMSESTDAMALVQEGIVVQANQAWADIFSDSDIDDSVGPLMDFFAESSHAALKGALIASGDGRWDSESLRAEARRSDSRPATLDLKLEPSTFDGEAATRLSVLRQADVSAQPTNEALVEQALAADPATGFFPRQRFLTLLTEKIDQRPRGGARALAVIRPDQFGKIEHEVGPVSSEDILTQIAQVIDEHRADTDLAGRMGGTVFALIVERGSLRDIEAWAENLLRTIRNQIFEVVERSLSLTCSIGIAELCSGNGQVDDLVRAAVQASQSARNSGGNNIVLEETTNLTMRTQKLDEIWAAQIKSALVSGRFRLMHMNIASLTGSSERIFDTFVRMIDEQNDEISASDFIGTAQRMGMMRAIDRWIIDASIEFCTNHASDLVFVKLSRDSILDDTLCDWITGQTQSANIRPDNLCFQVSEEDASQFQKQTIALAENLRNRGFRFAVEQFGAGRDSLGLLANTPMDFCKLDGSLMQSVANNTDIQRQITNIVAHSAQHGIKTIAARVENANTMAVLFQLGVAYMQGHYVHEPEVILEEVV